MEAEHVGVGLDDQPGVDRGAQVLDEHGLVLGGHGGEEVEGDPPTEHRHRRHHGSHVGFEAVDLAAHRLGHGPGQGRGLEVLDAEVAGAGDQLLEEEGVAAGAAVQGLDGPVRRVLLEHGGEELVHLGRAEPSELDVGDQVAPIEPGEQVGGGVAPGQPVGAVGADEDQRTAVGLGEQLEGGEALGVGPVQVLEHDEPGAPVGQRAHEVDAGPDPLLGGQALGPSRPRRSRGCRSRRSCPSASRNSSIGRPTVPGSAWPASTSVPAGALATSSWTSRVLPMPASPAIRAIVGDG